jgi:hypothetical protein
MSPRQVAEALDKNYHTTRCLLRKLEATGEIQHTDSQYVAIPVVNSGNQSDHSNQCNQRHQRHQSVPSALQHDDQVAYGEEPSLPAIDYSDDADYANESVSAYRTQAYESDASLAGSSLQHLSEAEDLLTERGDLQGTQDHRIDYAISVINRNQCNQSDLQHSQATLRVEQSDSDSALHANDASSGKARASPYAQSKKRCPHHPHARWIRFDPSGQAWCDKLDCWDSYRLMKIGEALDYRSLAEYTRGIVKIEQGREARSSFVNSQGSFAVLTATQYAIDLCKTLGVEVPDISVEVKRLVYAGQ